MAIKVGVLDDAWTVDFDGLDFVATDSASGVEVRISSPLNLDAGFADDSYTVHTFLFKGLSENSTFDVSVKGGGRNFALLTPANAVGSVDHDRAGKAYYAKCAYVIIRDILGQKLAGDPQFFEPYAGINGPIPFSDLFHDDTCFLLVDNAEASKVKNFSLTKIVPSLLANGFVPVDVCNPQELAWRSPIELDTKSLKVSLISDDIGDPELIGDLCSLAVKASGSSIMQFFYLYQIFEYLMESVLKHRLPEVAIEMLRKIENGSGDLYDDYSLLAEVMREKERLQLLVGKYSDCQSSLGSLASVSLDFMRSVNFKISGEMSGVKAVYAVRNFLFHQARNLPVHGESKLDAVVTALAQFIPELLATYKYPKHTTVWPLMPAVPS
ncbi:hypothetical protein [Arthrobacter sp. HY1533]|uniref:hypothetical protein n=1 Tax=Arthrobacter sp. HY1533 TaxID=2970919 RepID=UPI0022B9F8A2|nr:hypothetical protein [Arthrobacter sp. HY1533]